MEGTDLAQGLQENSSRPVIKTSALVCSVLSPVLEAGTPGNVHLDIHKPSLTASVLGVVPPVIEVYFSCARDDQLQFPRVEDRHEPGIDHLWRRGSLEKCQPQGSLIRNAGLGEFQEHCGYARR